MNKRLKILFLTPRYPYPLIGGDRLKSFHMMKHLVKSHDVTLVTFFQGERLLEENIREVENLGIKLHVVNINPLINGLKAGTIDLLRRPLEIGFYTQTTFRRIVDRLISETEFDLGISFFMRTAEYLKNKNIKKILVAEDCRILYQKRCYERSENLIQKMVRYWEYRRLKTYEPRIVDKFDAVTLVTEEDIKEMRSNNPKPKYRLLTNGTDIDYYRPSSNSLERKGLLFTGKLDVWNNELMALDIANNIFPKLKEQYPDLVFNIVGSSPPRSLQKLASDGIHIHPDVPDLLPYLQKAKIFMHPHIGASGIQNKVLEAMACGCAVVTTKTGIQGIPAIHEHDVMIGKNNEDHCNNALKILNDKYLAEKISNNARKTIEDTHSWELVNRQLDDVIKEVTES